MIINNIILLISSTLSPVTQGEPVAMATLSTNDIIGIIAGVIILILLLLLMTGIVLTIIR